MNRILSKKCRHVFIVGACGLVVLALATTLWKKVSAQRLFEQFVLVPVPQSVHGIRSDRDWQEIIGHIYVLRFKISRTDLALILQSRPFRQVEWIEYDDGHLTWGDAPLSQKRDPVIQDSPRKTVTESFALYASRSILARRPWWFNPNRWENPEVYVLKDTKARRIQILICDVKAEEVYFVERKFAR